MRLIDADELIVMEFGGIEFVPKEFIDEAPVVDVVPVVWLPLTFDGFRSNIPYEYDGRWIIVTDGKSISVERIKKDVYDRFYPDGRWFELEDVVAWMPLPKHYKEESDG